MRLDDAIDSREACQILGISQPTLSRWVRFGKIRTVRRLRTGGHGTFLFDRAVVERLAAAEAAEKAAAS